MGHRANLIIQLDEKTISPVVYVHWFDEDRYVKEMSKFFQEAKKCGVIEENDIDEYLIGPWIKTIVDTYCYNMINVAVQPWHWENGVTLEELHTIDDKYGSKYDAGVILIDLQNRKILTTRSDYDYSEILNYSTKEKEHDSALWDDSY